MRPLPLLRVLPLAMAALVCAVGPACRERAARPTQVAKPEASTLPDWLQRNRLAATPSGFLQRHSQAPVHWQPWTKETVTAAAENNRLIFLFVGSPVYSASDTALAAIHNSGRTVAALNDGTAIPILADAEANRELGRLIAVLSAEIRKPVAFPFLVWMSPQGNPIAWIPVDLKSSNHFLSLLDQSNSMVFRMWNDSPDYVCENSAKDSELRKIRMTKSSPAEKSAPPALDRITQSARTLLDLYNSESREIDGSGGLFPCATIEFLASAAHARPLPQKIRDSARDVTDAMVDALATSPMVDPLDGGICSARRGSGWNLPTFSRDTSTQARASIALLAAWHHRKEPRILQIALDALRFADSGLGTGRSSLVHSAPCPDDLQSSFLWTLEDIQKTLDPAEFEAVKTIMQPAGLGNIPPENDPDRRFFRLNFLALRKAPAAELAATFDSARRKLHKARAERLTNLPVETTVYARNLARLASAHAAAHAATGDTKHLDQAVGFLTTIREKYHQSGRGLRQSTADADPSFTHGRALDYLLAVHAAIDVHNLTLDTGWIAWADELMDYLAASFVIDGRLMECEPAVAPVDYPVSDIPMLFEESSVDLCIAAVARMSAFHRSLPPALLEVANRQLAASSYPPLVQADLLALESARHLHPTVSLPADPAVISRFLPALRKIHPRFITVVVRPADDSTAGVQVILPGPSPTTLSPASPDELLHAISVPTSSGS